MTVLSAAALDSDPLGCSLLASVIGAKRGRAQPSWTGSEVRLYSPLRQASRPAVKAYDPFFSTDPIGLATSRNEFDDSLWDGDDRSPDACVAGPLS
jgi:hypothetical protein